MNRTQKKVTVFGVGSFIFSASLNQDTRLEDIVLNLSSILNKIPGLKNLKVEPEFDAPRSIPAGNTELRFLNIDFDLDTSLNPDFKDGDDDFSIYSKSFYDVPVTIVVSNSGTTSPSMGVMKVREYLRSYLEGADFKLDVIGPSPFHANWLLHESNFFNVYIKHQRGYDEIDLYIDKPKRLEQIEDIFEKIGDELNLFYMMHDIEALRIRKWSEIESKNALVTEKSSRWFVLNDHVAEVMAELIEFESDSVMLCQLISDRFENTYKPAAKYLLPYNQKLKDNFRNYPVESVKGLLDFVVSKRSNFWQNLTTYVNTIINALLAIAIAYILFKIGIH